MGSRQPRSVLPIIKPSNNPQSPKHLAVLPPPAPVPPYSSLDPAKDIALEIAQKQRELDQLKKKNQELEGFLQKIQEHHRALACGCIFNDDPMSFKTPD
jgi:hypothetical protein